MRKSEIKKFSDKFPYGSIIDTVTLNQFINEDFFLQNDKRRNFSIESFSIYDAIKRAMDVYICCIILMWESYESFTNYLNDHDESKTRASFLDKSRTKQLRIICSKSYEDLLKAVWVEKKFN